MFFDSQVSLLLVLAENNFRTSASLAAWLLAGRVHDLLQPERAETSDAPLKISMGARSVGLH